MDNIAKNFEDMNAKINQKIEQNGGELKATLVIMGEWGSTQTMQAKITACELRGYAQYENGLYMELKKRGGRSLYSVRLYEAKDFAIFEGWHQPAEKMPGSYTAFDKAQFYKIVDSVDGEKLGEQSERLYAAERMSMSKKYKVVGGDCKTYESEGDLLEEYEKTGELHDNVRRIELQGAPILRGLCGPMYDGVSDGCAIIRYETREVYDALSC